MTTLTLSLASALLSRNYSGYQALAQWASESELRIAHNLAFFFRSLS